MRKSMTIVQCPRCRMYVSVQYSIFTLRARCPHCYARFLYREGEVIKNEVL